MFMCVCVCLFVCVCVCLCVCVVCVCLCDYFVCIILMVLDLKQPELSDTVSCLYVNEKDRLRKWLACVWHLCLLHYTGANQFLFYIGINNPPWL